MSKAKANPDRNSQEKTMQRRALMLCVAFVVVFSLLSARLVYVQVVKSDYYKGKAEKQHIRKVALSASRGRIIDRNGELLAGNRLVYQAYVDRYHIRDLNAAQRSVANAHGLSMRDVRRSFGQDEVRELYLERVSEVLHVPLGYAMPSQMVRRVADSKRSEIVISNNVDELRVRRLKELCKEHRIQGVYFREKPQRFHPNPRRATHVIGYVGHKGTGADGVERSLESTLSGKPGYRYIELDSRRNEIAAYRGEVVEPKNGKDVRLTIDMGIQNIVENVLEEVGDDPNEIYAPHLRAAKISVVLLDPNTGAVLAMANRPHFDLRTREGNLRNHAVSDTYEPGSTFKITAFSGVFDRKLVSPQTQVFCHGGRFEEKGVPALVDDHPNGQLSVYDVLAKSSNIGAYKLAGQLGRSRFYRYVKSFGFGTRTGIALPTEASGVAKHPSKWSLPSLSRMAMGYEVTVTPLQMVTAVTAVVNDGELLRPYIVDAILDREGETIEQRGREVVRRVMSVEASRHVRNAMLKACEPGGTGGKAVCANYSVAGKTGTAQRYDPSRKRYVKGDYNVSFVGFVPADKPRLLGVVVVDRPRLASGKLYGGTIAAPLFRRIAEQSMAYLDVAPTILAAAESAVR